MKLFTYEGYNFFMLPLEFLVFFSNGPHFRFENSRL
jgi:hypothetical protein